MKIKRLLIGLLACSAMVGCSDDVLENGIEQQEAKKMDAYISLSIKPNTSSSRSDGDGYGDEDGKEETSNHTASAVKTENTVNEVLVIVTPENDQVAVDPVVGTAATKNGFVKLLTGNQFGAEGSTVTMTTPERVDYIQPYKAMVVINPVPGLKTALDGKNHRQAYNEVCKYQGEGWQNLGSETAPNYSFMMANQSVETINPTEENQVPTNPATGIIEVERAISKITFRPVLGTSKDLDTDDNVYEIEVDETKYTANAVRYWYVTKHTATVNGQATQVDKYTYAFFNEATVSGRTESVWVLLTNGAQYDGGQVNPNDVVGFFEKKYSEEDGTLIEYTGYVDIEASEKEDAYVGNKRAALLKEITVTDKQAYLNTLKFVQDPKVDVTTSKKKYSIRLTNYALTNMAKEVFAVRHKVGATVNPCGPLDDDESILDPYTTAKNGWKAGDAIDAKWYDTNTLFSTIKGQAEAYTISNWKTLPTSLSISESQGVEGTTHTGSGTYSETGYLLRYCYENSVQVSSVNDNLISGIVFVGQILDDKGVAVPVLYKYKGKFFRTLKQLLMDDLGKNLTISENSDAAAIKKVGIETYKDGRCYYYAGIKHLDNGASDYTYNDANEKIYDTEKGVGNMEFAIMRNNIYSLAISGISGIGSSTLELTAGSNVADQSAFIDVECRIIDWIVRFNDIQF